MRSSILVVALLAAACATGSDPAMTMPDAAPTADAVRPPDGRPDASLRDAPTPDAPIPDAAIADARPDAPIPDARPPDAAIPDATPPDAAPPDGPCRVQLLGNADFEDTTGSGVDKIIDPWSTLTTKGEVPFFIDSSDELGAVDAFSKEGDYAARLGTADNVAHQLFQTVDVPAGTKRLELSGWFWVRSTEPPPAHDFMKIEVRDVQGTLIETLGTLTELDKGDDYVQRTFKGSNATHGGKARTLVFNVTTDISKPTDWFIDVLDLEAVICE